MHRIFRPLAHLVLLLGLLMVSVLVAAAASPPATVSPPPALLFDLPGAASVTSLHERYVLRSRTTGVRPELLDAATGDLPRAVLLPLFPDVVYTALLERAEIYGPARTTWTGRVEGVPGSEVVLSVVEGSIAGLVAVPPAFYQVGGSSQGGQVVWQLDQSAFSPEVDLPAPLQPEGAAGSQAPVVDCTDIDLMVVYTAEARTLAGGTSQIQALIDAAVGQTNVGYANSAVNQRLHLVRTGEVAYTEPTGPWPSSTWETVINQLTNPSDGQMDEVHPWRNRALADETVLLVASYDGICGMGWIPYSVSGNWENLAFAVVRLDCALGPNSFAHELGHTMGSHHDRANAGGVAAPLPYAYGYQDSTHFRTIMAQQGGCADPCPRINYWSNPAVSYLGRPTGISPTAPDAADNHLTLNTTACTVAAFRTPRVYLPLLVRVTAPSGITGRLTSQGAGAAGLRLQLRLWNGSAWSTHLETTTAADGSYRFASPASLDAGQQYYVRYVNNSGYGNTPTDAYLYNWFGRSITVYTTGTPATGGSFDVANIFMVAPESTATRAFPITFQWQRRTATPGDSYTVRIFGLGGDTAWLETAFLGYVSQYVQNSLPAGFGYGTEYGWNVGVYDGTGAGGQAYYYRGITFQSGLQAAGGGGPERAGWSWLIEEWEAAKAAGTRP